MTSTLFESYRQGLESLIAELGSAHLRLSEAQVYQQRLAENLDRATRYGDTDALKADRAEILDHCNALSLATTGKLFADFCPSVETLAQQPGESPYKGLLYFTEADADNFFGRDAWTARLVERLRANCEMGEGFLAVVGASGSGKSSLVRAGLIPALRKGAFPGTASWPIHIITPGAHPLESLAASLTRDVESRLAMAQLIDDMTQDARCLHYYVRTQLPDTAQHLLLVVDQFEETFTACTDAAERRAFVDSLLYATAVETAGPAVVVLTLRADFYTHCAQFDALREALARRQEYLGSLEATELRQAIEEPALRNGWTLQPGLTDLLLREVGVTGEGEPEPGALPLLSHALLETWKRREGAMLTLAGYAASGGVRGALAKTAEDVYTSLGSEEQNLARGIFLRLTELGEGAQDTRRTATLSELTPRPETTQAVETVLKTLADKRLVITEAENVEVAHEALIREWPTLRTWLDEDREGLRLHRQLNRDTQEWERLERDPDALYRGARLIRAAEWVEKHASDMNALEREFMTASQKTETRRAAEEEARQRRELEQAGTLAEEQALRTKEQIRFTWRLQVAFSIAVLFLVVAVIGFFTATNQTKQARDAEATSEAARFTAVAEGERADKERDAALNAQATAEAARSTAVAEGVRADRERDAALEAQTLAETRSREAETAQQEAARQARLGRIVRTRELAAYAQGIDDPTGSLNLMLARESALTTWLMDTTVITHSFVTNETLAALNFAIFKAQQSSWRMTIPWRTRHTGWVNAVAYSPDGKQIVSGSADRTVRVWDAQTGAEVQQLAGHTGNIFAVAYSPDGTRVASAGCDEYTAYECIRGSVRVWDAQTGKELHQLIGHTGPVNAVAYSPDGTRIVSGSGGWEGQDQTVRVWDAATGQELRQWVGHTWAWSVAYSPDGTRIVSGGNDGTVRVWDAMTGAKLQQWAGLPEHTSAVRSVAYSPDGTRIVSASDDWTVRVWDAATGAEVQQLVGHTGSVSSVVYSPDGTRIVSGSNDQTVRVWDAVTGMELHTLAGHTNRVNAVAYSPNGTRIVSASDDRTVRVWDAATGTELHTLAGHTSWVSSAAYSSDGTRIVSGSWDGTVRVWDAATGTELHILAGHTGHVFAVAYSPDGMRIVSGSADGTVRVWDAATGTEVLQFDDHTSYVFAVAYSPDGTRIVSGSADQTVRVWDAMTGAEVQQLAGHTGYVLSVGYSPDGMRIVSGGGDGTVRMWDAMTGREVMHVTPGGYVSAVVFSPDGQWVVSAGCDEDPGGEYVCIRGSARVWDAVTGAELHTLIEHPGRVDAVAYSPDGTHIVSASDQTVQVWDVSNTLNIDAEMGAAVQQLVGHTRPVYAVAYDPDGTHIVSAGEDQTIRIWNAATGTELHTLAGHTGWASSVVYSPDGTRIVSGGQDKTVRVWDAATGQELHTLAGHTDWVMAVAYSLDGMRIVSGSIDRTVRVWDAVTGAELHALAGHTGAVLAVAYSPDGTRIVSGSADRTVRVWDAQSGEELRQFTGHTGYVEAVVYSSDGTRIVSGSNDGTVRVWDAATDQALHTLVAHTGYVEAVAYSPDGTRMASAGCDEYADYGCIRGSVRVWDARTGAEVQQLARHSGYVNAVAYSPDGTRIVSGGEDGTLWIWNMTVTLWASADRLRLAQCTGYDGWVHVVEYRPDGQSILIASDDKTRQMFLEDADYLLKLADCLIQRDPPIFVGEERSLYRFDEWPAAEH